MVLASCNSWAAVTDRQATGVQKRLGHPHLPICRCRTPGPSNHPNVGTLCLVMAAALQGLGGGGGQAGMGGAGAPGGRP